ncbi:MAG TPA: hypothetical protein VD927_04705 [Chryseosolibacter sp.]|nr:hypothetical protein [Chryseosolibacter sp.]
MPDIKEKIIPPQHAGGKKDIEHKVAASDDDDARKLFVIGRNRLLDVNNWSNVAEGLSAKFHLTDQNGIDVERTAEKTDCFKIDIPAPGPAEGDGHDWVKIEAIEDKSDSQGPSESIAIRVRPCPNPRERQGENVAHFLDEKATSTFVVQRNGREITAAVYGRNEKPNTDTTSVIDKVRNAVVGTTAIMGMSNVQWKNLVQGLIAIQKD